MSLRSSSEYNLKGPSFQPRSKFLVPIASASRFWQAKFGTDISEGKNAAHIKVKYLISARSMRANRG